MHGIQSDTVTIGINLASAATGRRGLYVGATRGRERNTIHVITDSDDLDEARDILEAVLAKDRADVPAVAQRQFLAKLVTDRPRRTATRRPAPATRCELPGEFAAVAAWAHEQLARARAAVRTSDRARHELNELTEALDAVAGEYEPHRAALVAAERASTDARLAVDDARRRVNSAHRRHRRDARRQLAAAEQALGAATSDLERIEETAAEPRDRYDDLRSRHETARRTVMSRSILDEWRNPENRVEQIEQLLDALDTWEQWARGHDIPTDRLTRSAATLDNHGHHSARVDARRLAATVDLWATQAGISLAHPTLIEGDLPAGPQRNGLDVGLDR